MYEVGWLLWAGVQAARSIAVMAVCWSVAPVVLLLLTLAALVAPSQPLFQPPAGGSSSLRGHAINGGWQHHTSGERPAKLRASASALLLLQRPTPKSSIPAIIDVGLKGLLGWWAPTSSMMMGGMEHVGLGCWWGWLPEMSEEGAGVVLRSVPCCKMLPNGGYDIFRETWFDEAPVGSGATRSWNVLVGRRGRFRRLVQRGNGGFVCDEQLNCKRRGVTGSTPVLLDAERAHTREILANYRLPQMPSTRFQSERMVPTGPNPLHNSNRSQVIFP